MQHIEHHVELSGDIVLSSLESAVSDGRQSEAVILSRLGEVEERRLYLERAYASMFDYCLRRLRMSESEATRRIRVARLARRFPTLLDAVADGRTHLSNLLLLHDLFTTDNVEWILEATAGKTKRQVEIFIAELAPKPDVAPSIRKHPEQASLPALAAEVLAGAPARSASGASGLIGPLSPGRYEFRFTGGEALVETIERVRGLLRHRIPDGDLAAVIQTAVDALLEKLEKEKLGKTSRPQKNPRPSSRAGHISQATRREVLARDGEQCAFVSAEGVRCTAREFLEFDHRHPHALGGTGETSNVRLLCRQHNRYEAERVFGREHVEARIRARQDARPRPSEVARTPSSPSASSASSGASGPDTIAHALLGLGFRAAEARRAVAAIPPDHWTRPPADLLREALASLTSWRERKAQGAGAANPSSPSLLPSPEHATHRSSLGARP